jgi:hypothetical protein
LAAGVVLKKSLITTLPAKPLKVYFSELPSSLDPMEYDHSKHHPIQSIFHIKLISPYKNQKISPQLAKSWKVSESDKVWEFEIRNDVFFTDGSKVTSEVAAAALKRAVFQLKRSKSKHEILKKLEGIDGLTRPNSKIVGINTDKDKLVLRFSSPYPRLLEALFFGIFAIVHPDSFDSASGEWINKKIEGAIGAGPFQVVLVNSEVIELEKKSHYPADLVHEKAFSKITFFKDKDRIGDADLASLSSDNEALAKTHRFFGRRAMHILYLLCHGWKLPESPLHSIENRRALRDQLEKEMKVGGRESPGSFFPIVMPGIEPSKVSDQRLENMVSKKPIRVLDIRPAISPVVNLAIQSVFNAIEKSGIIAESVAPVPMETAKKLLNPDLNEYLYDLGLFATGISIEDPAADVRLMFSPEGIRLPDLDGRIAKELEDPNFHVQKVNDLIREQALVWPVAHYSVGTWASGRVDFDAFNVLMPLGELQWIGQKQR